MSNPGDVMLTSRSPGSSGSAAGGTDQRHRTVLPDGHAPLGAL